MGTEQSNADKFAITLREAKVRRSLDEDGYKLDVSPSRGKPGRLEPYDFGGYMIFDAQTRQIVSGEGYALSLEDVERWAAEEH